MLTNETLQQLGWNLVVVDIMMMMMMMMIAKVTTVILLDPFGPTGRVIDVSTTQQSDWFLIRSQLVGHGMIIIQFLIPLIVVIAVVNAAMIHLSR